MPMRCMDALALCLLAAALVRPGAAVGQTPDPAAFEIYGFVQTDYVQDFNRVNPAWDDTLRPSRIPTTEGQFGDDGQAIIGIRQSRFGVRGNVPVGQDRLRTQFEFDLFGVGVDEGQTTIRVRHVYGAWGNWLIGQTNSTFMDIDIFPNVVDYWGPAGMVFVRNPQIRWTPTESFALALEKPSDDIDAGQFRTVDPGLANFQADEEFPDVTAHYRRSGDWGHFQIAGILRKVGVENIANPADVVERDDTGWGVNLTSSIRFGERDKLLVGIVHGDSIASYMNDGGVDMAPTTAVPTTADAGAVPLLGISVYFDHYWSSAWSTSFGYSSTEVDNLEGQEPSAFDKGEYFSANVLHTPAENMLVGAEVLWGQRTDFGGASGDDVRIQFSFKYNFGAKL